MRVRPCEGGVPPVWAFLKRLERVHHPSTKRNALERLSPTWVGGKQSVRLSA